MIDLYDPNFLHGTEKGYTDGCHGKQQCTLYGSDYLTCLEVHGARASDYNLHKLSIFDKIRRDTITPINVAALTKPAPRFEPPFPSSEGVETFTVDAAVAPDPMLAVNEVLVSSKDDHDATQSAPVVPAAGIDPHQLDQAKRGVRLPIDHPNFPHGTTGGFSRGCKDEATCPGNAEGITCRQATRDYQKEWHANKAAAKAPAAKAHPTSIPVTQADIEAADPSPALDPAKVLAEVQAARIPTASERDALITDLRDELANAERATSELKTEHRRALQEYANTINGLRVELGEALAKGVDLTRINTSLAARVHELEGELEVLRESISYDLEHEAEHSQELVPAPAAPIEPTGGATHPSQQLALTINPTKDAGIALGFTMPGTGLSIRVALAASGQPGLGDLAISVGSN